MRKILFLFFVIAASYFSSCKPSNDKIKNDIKIKENGLHVEEAYLTNDAGQNIDDNNKVETGERVCLRLVIDGWQIKDGKVFLDASQKVATSSGTFLTSNPSILGPVYTDGAAPKDAKYVLLYQRIGQLGNTKDHIVITFKIWDKTTNKSIDGSYELYM